MSRSRGERRRGREKGGSAWKEEYKWIETHEKKKNTRTALKGSSGRVSTKVHCRQLAAHVVSVRVDHRSHALLKREPTASHAKFLSDSHCSRA